jgi:hypothetical protein
LFQFLRRNALYLKTITRGRGCFSENGKVAPLQLPHQTISNLADMIKKQSRFRQNLLGKQLIIQVGLLLLLAQN